MKNILLIILFFSSLALKAQFEIPSAADVNKFFTTKTMIVLEDNPMSQYNILIKDAVPKIWTVTPYGFCTRKDFDEIKNKSGVSILSIEEFFFENDKSGVKYNFLCLALGNKVNDNDTYFDLFHFPLSYFEAEEEEYMHNIPVVLRIMQQFIVFVKNNPGVKKPDVKKNFFAGPSELSGMTLYLAKEDIEESIRSESRFKEIYTYKYKFVSYEELEEKLLNPESSSAVLFKVGLGKGGEKARCYKAILGADNGKVYYFDYHIISDSKPDALLEEDLKKLVKP